MRLIALKMLMGDRAKYIGILIGITFASLLITQQSAIFTGLMTRTYGFLSDTGGADIWVMDPSVEHIDDIKSIKGTELYRVRSVPGVEWAVPLYKGIQPMRLPNGNEQQVWLIGIDDSTLIGGPPKFREGELAALRLRDGVIVDYTEGEEKLRVGDRMVQVGETVEINEHDAQIVGISENSRTFQSQPTVYTTYQRALEFAGPSRKMLSFVLVGAAPELSPKVVAQRIQEQTGLRAFTTEGFKKLTYDYYFDRTGIPINFGIAVLLGFIVGTVIAGQTFYNFTLDNMRYFGTFKAMGASNTLILRMIMTQALFVGFLGYGFGVGLAAIFGMIASGTRLSFRLEWSLLGMTAIAVLLICVIAAFVSARRVLKLEPAVVFRT